MLVPENFSTCASWVSASILYLKNFKGINRSNSLLEIDFDI